MPNKNQYIGYLLS